MPAAVGEAEHLAEDVGDPVARQVGRRRDHHLARWGSSRWVVRAPFVRDDARSADSACVSPFPLPDGNWVSCTAGRYEFPLEHAAGCPCPCAMCIEIDRRVLESLGRLDVGRPPAYIFVFAGGELRVAEEPAGEGSDRLFQELFAELPRTEAHPTASFGWLTATDRPGVLSVAKVPSDPYPEASAEALEAWAAERQIELRRPWSRGPGHSRSTPDEGPQDGEPPRPTLV